MSNVLQRAAYSLSLVFGLSSASYTLEPDQILSSKKQNIFSPLSTTCKKELVTAGVLTKNGKPVGHALLNKSSLRVALIDADKNGAYPKGALTEEIKNYFKDLKFLDNLTPSPFPIEVISTLTPALKAWSIKNVKLVPFDKAPDLKIFAYKRPFQHKGESGDDGGFASFPKNDQSQFPEKDLSVPVVFIRNVGNQDKFSSFITTFHEFGHVLGIEHPKHAADRLTSTECKKGVKLIYGFLEAYHPHGPITLFTNFNRPNLGLMAHEDRFSTDITFYEEAAREYIRSNGKSFGHVFSPDSPAP